MYRALRAVGFRMDPERAHHAALRLLRATAPFRRRSIPVSDPVEVAGLRFPNRVGLAAGYDKDGTAWRALARLGFGHVEVGTVTPRRQAGNPRPRIVRLPEQEALVNWMGFPGDGADAVAARLQGRRPDGLVLGVSIGPNADTPPERRVDDYLALVDVFAPAADYLAINVSSPNTAGLRDLQEGIGPLLDTILQRRTRPVPVFVKISPDLPDPARVARDVEEAGGHGLIVGNTTTTRPGVVGAPERGGLSGRPLGPLAVEVLRRVAAATSLPVIACGGIMSPEGARERRDAGASLVQVYTGLAYRGPRLVREIVAAARPPR